MDGEKSNTFFQNNTKFHEDYNITINYVITCLLLSNSYLVTSKLFVIINNVINKQKCEVGKKIMLYIIHVISQISRKFSFHTTRKMFFRRKRTKNYHKTYFLTIQICYLGKIFLTFVTLIHVNYTF